MNIKIKCWVSKGDITNALKNKGEPSKIDISYDYADIWFAKDSIPDRRGIIEAELVIKSRPKIK